MTAHELDELMRQLLTRMLTISYGKTQSFSSSTRGGERQPCPPGESSPMHEKWASAYNQATGLARKYAVYTQAKKELDAWQGRAERDRVKVDAEEEAKWVVEDGEGHDVEAVALKFRMSVTRVRKLRLAAGRNAETGKPFVPVADDDRDVKARALAMAEQGYSPTQIRRLTGANRSSVYRWLGKAA